jgi:LysM repeat protein
VRWGDTLSGLAKRYGVTVTELRRANGLSAEMTLRAGESLKIPG